MRPANAVVGRCLLARGAPELCFFCPAWWLVLGAITLAVGVSVVAGFFPVRRAARVDPVEALRPE